MCSVCISTSSLTHVRGARVTLSAQSNGAICRLAKKFRTGTWVETLLYVLQGMYAGGEKHDVEDLSCCKQSLPTLLMIASRECDAPPGVVALPVQLCETYTEIPSRAQGQGL